MELSQMTAKAVNDKHVKCATNYSGMNVGYTRKIERTPRVEQAGGC
jgi:hypothetical protein